MKTQKQTWSSWLITTRKLLSDKALPKDNAQLRHFFDAGNSPLETFECLWRAESTRENETVLYSDGTVCTGVAPLPPSSPLQPDSEGE